MADAPKLDYWTGGPDASKPDVLAEPPEDQEELGSPTRAWVAAAIVLILIVILGVLFYCHPMFDPTNRASPYSRPPAPAADDGLH